MIKYLSIACFLSVFVLTSYAETSDNKINVKNIEIKRDIWGVPHIFGKTDAEVAYGLAWATAEDDPISMQQNLLIPRSRLGEYLGKDGAIIDYIVALFEIKDFAYERYEKDLSDKFKSLVDAYVQGANDYYTKHPDQLILKDILPVTKYDVIAGYVMGMVGLTNVAFDLIYIMNGGIKHKEQLANLGKGSNGIAVNGKRTNNGRTFLAVNSHQPIEGPQSWYECHLHSEEGWNMLGGTFPGGLTIFHGVSPNHGWAHTVNWPDGVDIYRLTMHPKKKNFYKYDGQWLELKQKKIKLKVKWWIFKIPIRKKAYYSVFGPVLKNKKKYYAIKATSTMDIRSAEQMYHMNKSYDVESFKAALRMHAFPGFNTVYADKSGNLLYYSAGFFPERDPNYDWINVLPGDTSLLNWEAKFAPIDSLPMLQNPSSGYIFNTNNTPFNASADIDNLRPEDYNKTYGYNLNDNNRSIRLKSLMEGDTSISYEEFKKYKFDREFAKPMYTWAMSNIEILFELNPDDYPKLAPELKKLKTWDRKAVKESESAAFLILGIKFLLDEMLERGLISNQEEVIPLELYIESMMKAKKHLKRHFGGTDVTLGDVLRHRRADVDLPMGGMPDVLAATTPKDDTKGRLICDNGDSYVMLAQFDSTGLKALETINAYGASTIPGNPHYTDQMEMYVNQELKEMSLDIDWINSNLERSYHPE